MVELVFKQNCIVLIYFLAQVSEKRMPTVFAFTFYDEKYVASVSA